MKAPLHNTRIDNTTGNKGESHRIYWQQWLGPSVNGAATFPDNGVKSRRDLITSSAAVRISPTGARAIDVTQLLRQTLNISALPKAKALSKFNQHQHQHQHQQDQDQDCLVLVGTLYSLPRDYVQFQHEQHQQQQHQHQQATNPQDTQSPQSQSQHLPSRSDPFHVVRTLRPDDNPVQVRDRMAAHLQKLLDQKQQQAQTRTRIQTASVVNNGNANVNGNTTTTRTIISPKLQWYFVPAATETASPIPNCIDLDGYCTSMEDQDEELDHDSHSHSHNNNNNNHNGMDYEDEDDNHDKYDHDYEKDEHDCQTLDGTPNDESQSLLQSRFPWLQSTVATLPADTDERNNGNRLAQQRRRRRRRVCKEDRRYQELSSSQSALRNCCMSGYLLKRSRRDPHVWRRVHCVLTDDYLWYVSRMYTDTAQDLDQAQSKTQTPPLAKHGRIRLTRALLLEPAPEYVPLYRTPNAFEVVSARGTAHIFRAASKPLQLKWIQALSERIVQSYENSLLENAELIVADECLARNRRRTSVAVQPLWDAVCTNNPDQSSCSSSVQTVRVGAILRLGVEVAEYRECCRHVQARMPAKSPVVVTTPRRASPRSGDVQRIPVSASIAFEPMDPVLQDMIRATWEHAAALLARVSHVSLQVQSGSTDHKRPSRSIETQCRHIDYVITGRFRSARSLNGELAAADSMSSTGMSSTSGTNSHDEPPPTDLFDSLLAELQGLAASPQLAIVTGTSIGTENGTTNGENHHHDRVI
jgi:hypothetical protein